MIKFIPQKGCCLDLCVSCCWSNNGLRSLHLPVHLSRWSLDAVRSHFNLVWFNSYLLFTSAHGVGCLMSLQGFFTAFSLSKLLSSWTLLSGSDPSLTHRPLRERTVKHYPPLASHPHSCTTQTYFTTKYECAQLIITAIDILLTESLVMLETFSVWKWKSFTLSGSWFNLQSC